ncbi:elongation factor 1-alpha C-terminal domain-related protein, partial [Nonomuraea basaltis]|uniref:elongation factor 1-alpha C-terminal domain-related protein n=1 Tax=Nonomuraea basaltis TaxID=2495887 RepID=UPI003B848B55
RVSLRITQPLFVDDYGRNRLTGGFILVDEATNGTVGAGMIMELAEGRRAWPAGRAIPA